MLFSQCRAYAACAVCAVYARVCVRVHGPCVLYERPTPGQDMIKSILRDYQSDSSVTAEVREASAGDNLLIQEETKTALAMIAVRLHVNVTTDGAASASGVSRASVPW